MNFITGEIVRIYIKEGSLNGKVRVGDDVLIKSGPAISGDERLKRKEK